MTMTFDYMQVELRFLHPTRRKIDHFRYALPSQSLG